MNEEIEYAEMLEIPVSTVNVVRKKRGRKRKTESVQAETVTPAQASSDLKESVIAQVNDKLLVSPEGENASVENGEITADAQLFAESANSEGVLDFNDIPQRIDTVRLYSEDERFAQSSGARLYGSDYALDGENGQEDGGMYRTNRETRAQKRARIVLAAEFAAACALCGAIFLTNVFMPGSAINTFFRSLGGEEKAAATDVRSYEDFTLSSVVSSLSDTELTLDETGVLTFQDECCVYPAADGTVSAVEKAEDGTYTVRIAHSDSFSGVIGGLDVVYYAVGDEVKANVPVGFTGGETQVQVTMYSGGELLNCFRLTEENCLAWTQQE